MRCVTPMVRMYFDVEKEYEDQKIWQKIVPRHEVFENMQANENYLTRIQDRNLKLQEEGSLLRYQLIACKHCWACKLNKAKEWAIRLMYECKYHEHRYYITLTYDEENLPLYERMQYTDKDGTKWIFENDGTWSGTLEPEDVTKFLKRLRKKFRLPNGKYRKIKYYYAGEYGGAGEKNARLRPHYHMILFGAPLDISQFYDFYNDPVHKKLHWKSKELDELWGKGIVDIAEVEFGSCSYVARYNMKSINDINPIEYAKIGKIKEFVRMSLRPSIGLEAYNDFKKQIYDTDEVVIQNVHGEVRTVKPPKAWDEKFKKEFPEQWENIKASREACAERTRQLLKELNEGITDLEIKEREAEKLTKIGQLLPRSDDF